MWAGKNGAREAFMGARFLPGFRVARKGAAPMRDEVERLKLEVKLMDDPCLWRWDIRDIVHEAIVQSSWDQEWTAYPSREEAYRAGRERLNRVLDRKPDAGTFGQWRFGASA
jgi:hypothetical protein